MRAILARTDGTSQDVVPKNGKKFSLDEMYDLLKCDTVEHLDLVQGVHLWCDEEARLNNPENVNALATKYFHKAFPADKYDWSMFGGQYDIVGDVLIIDNTKSGWLNK